MSGPSFIKMNNKHLILTFSAIYFDGKESDSLRWVDGKNQLVKEETYTIVAYPHEKTLGLVTINDKTGKRPVYLVIFLSLGLSLINLSLHS